MIFHPNHQLQLNGNNLEIPRKLFHLSGILLLFIPYIFKTQAKIIFLALVCLVSTIEFLRLRSHLIANVLVKIFGHLMRPLERKKLSGSFYYLWGVSLSFLFFDKISATKGLLILAIADPLASLIGIKFGNHRFLKKTLEGTLAFFLVSILILYCFKESLHNALIIGAICALAENVIPINDNLILPLLVASLSYIIK